jgi:hypothetical protein
MIFKNRSKKSSIVLSLKLFCFPVFALRAFRLSFRLSFGERCFFAKRFAISAPSLSLMEGQRWQHAAVQAPDGCKPHSSRRWRALLAFA